MTGYICRHCGFRVAVDRVIDNCPYCDKKGLEREKDAEELLDGIDEQ